MFARLLLWLRSVLCPYVAFLCFFSVRCPATLVLFAPLLVASFIACLNSLNCARVFSWAGLLVLPGLACPARVFPLWYLYNVLLQAATVRLLSFLSSVLLTLRSPLLVFLRLLPVGSSCGVLFFEGWGFRLRWGEPRGRSAIPHEDTPRPKCMCVEFVLSIS